ncbi:MAG: diguanylate cyclase, partial [Chloroflexia bacterium]
MGPYIIRRLLQAIPLLFVISFVLYYVVFSLGDPTARLVANNPRTTPQDIERIRKMYGLDKPIHLRYFVWAGNVVTGDWGQSVVTRQDVIPILRSRVGNTLLL